MALGTTIRTRTALRRISAALKDFAKEQGWGPDDYKIFFRVASQDWGRITIFFIVKDFGGLSRNEMWVRVTDYLEHSLQRGGDIGFSIGLSVRTFDQVAQGRSNSVPDGYVEEEILLGPCPDE